MKKFIVSGLVLATFLTPSVSSAQGITSVELNTQLEALKQQLIELLLEQIAVLQAQIDELVTVQSPVVEPHVVILGSSSPVATLGEPYCNPGDSSGESVIIPVSITGSWNYGFIKAGNSKQEFDKHNLNFHASNNIGTTTVTIELGKERKEWNSLSPVVEHRISQEVFIGDLCE